MCGKKPHVQRNVLPVDPKPKHYDLHITPNFDDFTFQGVVAITIEATAPCTRIVLNYAELTFDSGSVTSGAFTQSFSKDDFALDEKDMRVAVTLSQAVQGEVKLVISYRGTINDKLHGFYRSKYTVRGKEAYMGTTQFEAVDARRALPCWDEPTHKATFNVTLVVPKHLRALSNMPEVSRVEEGDLAVCTFDTTPIMSTYLLAWTIGELEVIERTIKKSRGGETLVRVFAPEGKIKQGEFALDCACKVLPLYESFFGSDYFIPKCDLLAIPDFAAGAMENWGLITYRETALLCDENSSAVHRQWVALVVAHELAHQWFGNLVTMDWWKELWLNEAFATWVEYWAVDTLFPSWNIFTQFVNDETGRALALDSLRSSHPVEVDVVNAQEIDEIFDAISYCKGGSILRMAIEFIGIDAFRTGIQNYLEHFKFRNATTVDLWKFLGDAAGKDLAPILDLWTGEQGYPYLTVDKQGGVLHITQHRFLSTGDATAEEDQTIWQVPLLLRVAGEDTDTAVVLAARDNTVTVSPTAEWFKVNSRQAAFCRVKYSTELLPAVNVAIATKAVGNVDRLSVVSDYLAFAQGAFVSTVDIFRLLASYEHEDDYTVWCAIINAESEIRNVISTQGTDAIEAFNKFFIGKLYGAVMNRLGYFPRAEDDHRTSQLRGAIFNRMTSMGSPEAIAAARQMFEKRAESPISADLRGSVYATVVREGDSGAFEWIKELAESTTDAMERARCLRALGASRDPAVLQGVIEYGLSEKVRAQDSLYIFGSVSGNPKSQAFYVETLIREWPLFWKRLPGMLLGRIVKAVESAADAALANKLEAFWPSVEEQQRMAMERSFRQGVEGIRNNAKWAARDAAEVVAYLRSL